MLAPWWRLPSPGSSITFSIWQTIQPRSSSTTYQSTVDAGMRLPGNVLIVPVIHARMASRPSKRPKWCSTYVASSVNSSAHALQSPVAPARAPASC
jgi:hypothetical protein